MRTRRATTPNGMDKLQIKPSRTRKRHCGSLGATTSRGIVGNGPLGPRHKVTAVRSNEKPAWHSPLQSICSDEFRNGGFEIAASADKFPPPERGRVGVGVDGRRNLLKSLPSCTAVNPHPDLPPFWGKEPNTVNRTNRTPVGLTPPPIGDGTGGDAGGMDSGIKFRGDDGGGGRHPSRLPSPRRKPGSSQVSDRSWWSASSTFSAHST